MSNPLVNFVNTVVPLPKAEEKKLLGFAEPLSLRKGDAFIKEGSVPKKLAFVSGGMFRYYYLSKKGTEFTKGFFLENSFITSYSAMVAGIQSPYTIQALEDSDIFVIHYKDWQKLYNGHPCWSTLLIAFLQKGFSKKEKREKEFLLFNARERYESFLGEYPTLEDRISQGLIASYLGITPVALSRIRRQMT